MTLKFVFQNLLRVTVINTIPGPIGATKGGFKESREANENLLHLLNLFPCILSDV